MRASSESGGEPGARVTNPAMPHIGTLHGFSHKSVGSAGAGGSVLGSGWTHQFGTNKSQGLDSAGTYCVMREPANQNDTGYLPAKDDAPPHSMRRRPGRMSSQARGDIQQVRFAAA